MNILDIEINNNVKLEELYNNKYWIHGNSKNDILITIFLITINGHQLQYSLDSINNLDLDIPVLVNVIMDIKPTNKAYNTMVERCTTEYFIQLDEDMEIYNNTINIIYEHLKLNRKRNKHIFLHSFKLIDEYLGLGEQSLLLGLKLYNYNIMKNYQIPDNSNAVSQVDKLWHGPIEAIGYTEMIVSKTIGYHAKHRKPYDLLLRFSKSTSSFLNQYVKKNSGDYCRILRPISKIPNIKSIYSFLYYHFICLNYEKDIYNKNFNIFEKTYYKYINTDALSSYNIPENYENIPKNINKFNFNDFMNLFNIEINYINEYYVLIGIINTLFGNYAYSFDKYPDNINTYFSYVFKLDLGLISNENNNFHKNFICWDNINISNDIINKDNIYDYIIDLNDNIIFKDIKNTIFNIKRKNKTILLTSNENINIKNKDYYIFIIDNNIDFIKYINNNYYINESIIDKEYKFYKIFTKPNNDKYIIDNINIFNINDYIIENSIIIS